MPYADKEDKKKWNHNNYLLNKDACLERGKKYREDHHERLHEQVQCECGGHYVYKCKARHFSSAKHQNYLNNPKTVQEREQEKHDRLHEQVKCGCGGHYVYKTKARHFRGAIHQKFMNSQP